MTSTSTKGIGLKINVCKISTLAVTGQYTQAVPRDDDDRVKAGD